MNDELAGTKSNRERVPSLKSEPSAAASKALSSAAAVAATASTTSTNGNNGRSEMSPLNISSHSPSSRGGAGGGKAVADNLSPLPIYGRSVSNTSTHSDTSVRSGGSSHGSSTGNGSSGGGGGGKKNGGMGHRSQGSILGLDKMIDEKRDAKTMSERVVHIEVRSIHVIFDFFGV